MLTRKSCDGAGKEKGELILPADNSVRPLACEHTHAFRHTTFRLRDVSTNQSSLGGVQTKGLCAKAWSHCRAGADLEPL